MIVRENIKYDRNINIIISSNTSVKSVVNFISINICGILIV